jgi:hypothetical protein
MRSLMICTTANYSGDQIEKNEKGGACSAYGGENRCMQVLVGKSRGRRPLGRQRRRWENNIKMEFQDVECGAQTGLICLRIGTGNGQL